MSSPEHIVLLGSTGSIGTQTLDVVRRMRACGEAVDIVALAAGRNADRLADQVSEFGPERVVVADDATADAVRRRHPRLPIAVGEEALADLAGTVDAGIVVNAVVGARGLLPTLAALERGRVVALANKESLVVGGELIAECLRSGEGEIRPIDSEHSALVQCLRAGERGEVRRLVLTASGGALLDAPPEALPAITPEDVLAHPAWSMGHRVTVDSATMVNKALEVIEAHFLFELPYEQIDVLVQPGATTHALVEFSDGAWISQLAPTDMRLPIAYALGAGRRLDLGLSRLGTDELRELRFLPVDGERFPAFHTMLGAARHGAAARAVVNAADEVLVERFLDGDLAFPGIAAGLDAALREWRAVHASAPPGDDLTTLLDADRRGREAAQRYVEEGR
ncbi:MAG: 1-deoxy-D-xylulose-5-phosphate reductoisomerase [Candidatus Bipolaricaulota bacterium]|nr:MAG: 1-deoxy-D-xylulose-5-phosphate reductoisomerase [Candidatus Bipolaricaulota bacterium]